jgi:hypothetical protein
MFIEPAWRKLSGFSGMADDRCRFAGAWGTMTLLSYKHAAPLALEPLKTRATNVTVQLGEPTAAINWVVVFV